MFSLMANKRKTAKKSKFTHCKITLTSHPKAPWRVSFPVEVDGKTVRKRRMFSTEDRADAFAEEHEQDVADYGVRFGSITTEARRAFDLYRDARQDLRAEGIEVPTFEALVIAAVASLRREHEERKRNRMTVSEAQESFLAYKKSRVGDRHYADLKGHLGRFSDVYGTRPLDSVSATTIEQWLDSIPKLGPATRNKYRKSLKSIFAYGCAKDRAWCHSNPLAGIEAEKETKAEPRAYTPEDAEAILVAALEMKSPILPSLALGFFAGLRPSEIAKIGLETIDLDSSEFRVPNDTKTGARMAPLTPACKAWLTAQERRKGKAWLGSGTDHSVEMRAVLQLAKVTGIFDGLRHSFISYRVAEIRDVARVSDECGNSPNIIRKHYRQIVTTEAAKKFFAIRPVKAGRKSKITNIETGRKTA
jgi:integrase